MKEFQIINKYFKPLAQSHHASQNLLDDVAKISLKPSEELIISKDLAAENVHFLLKDGGFKIAKKILYANLSDLASAGAKPLYYMLGFSKNDRLSKKFYSDFAKGLKEVQDEFRITLIGGDTVKAEQLTFSITIFGAVEKNTNMLRSQAQSGDLIFVSGFIGDAYLARLYPKSYKNTRHFFPIPRIELGKKLVEKKLSKCAADISDGLLADLNNIALASNLEAEIFLDKIPLSKNARKFLLKNPQENILNLITAGDDYELIFAVSKKNADKINALAKALNLDLTCIGSFKKNRAKVTLLDKNNKKITIKKLGYEH